MNEQDRLFVFITEDKLLQGNAIFKSIDKEPFWTGDNTFGGVILSTDGNLPVTHYACNTAADIDYRSALFGTSHSPWMDVYKRSDGWTWDTACADMGLQVINEVV